MGRYGPGVTYTVPRWATINAPPPMGPLFGIWHDVYWSHECVFTAPPCPCYLKRNGRDHPFELFVYDKSDHDMIVSATLRSSGPITLEVGDQVVGVVSMRSGQRCIKRCEAASTAAGTSTILAK